MRCECGCGFEGEDEVTQFCIEEASMLALDLAEQAAQEEAEQESRPAVKPGEITDPEVAEAMARAKELHLQTFGPTSLGGRGGARV